ncbi:hypothetical protein FKM82_026882 [Ascaphus truei]
MYQSGCFLQRLFIVQSKLTTCKPLVTDFYTQISYIQYLSYWEPAVHEDSLRLLQQSNIFSKYVHNKFEYKVWFQNMAFQEGM